ncbi:uncharacterized protein LOC121534685 [Coregonus clupeaformis]|uniref:uncharacterized protein LOC121534685 n=1 Tax=Coregonus clupeaformis TaxID=59861 RepID=UPI001BE0B507|nr:uncharacterized protein LOC121534685 [Coregonus clupeaformis]
MMRMKQMFIFVILLTIYFQLATSNGPDQEIRRRPAPQEVQGAQGNAAEPYAFGDIIKFNRQQIGIRTYSHYAIYVGNRMIQGKTTGQDIFHFSGELFPPGSGDCVFAKLEDVTQGSTHYVDNYGDTQGLQTRTVEDMTKVIMDLNNSCQGTYSVSSNNCEHLATFIRYGSASCIQGDTNTFTGFLASLFCNNASTPALLKKNVKRGRGRRGLGLLRDETHSNQGAPAA